MYKEMIKTILFLSIIVFISSCGNELPEEEVKFISSIEKHRTEYNSYMKDDANSPFNYKSKVEFHPLNYFEPNSEWLFKSKLFKYESGDTVVVYGTKGEERIVVRYGYVTINKNEKDYDINVYQGRSRTGNAYYSIWFTDKTTNESTYGVGRYINFTINEDPDFEYIIDFNLAFNPYCAYSSEYSCAIPTKEDYIDLAIEAGEQKFHD